ncbi:MAG TPA: DUF2306 domain-containing protein [Burkholderiales bacterium]|nr:DUF2306 domain-containing protein [Burkholderiales bacterium]
MNYGFDAVIVTHAVAALLALAAGGALFLMRKGNRLHRYAGRAWVALMLVTAISSFWIQTKGHFSPIHLLSVGTLAALAAIVYYAVTGELRRHRFSVIATYVGALVVAGTFTLLPNRLFGRMLWSSLGFI